MMNINWLIGDSTNLDPTVDLLKLKKIGSFWGSWRTWRGYQTDNVICHDVAKAQELIDRQFYQKCNFYISNSAYQTLGRPENVKLYEGDFIHDIKNHEEIVGMHLVASVSDVVLLLGFDFTEKNALPDKLEQHRAINYRNLVNEAIKNNPSVQWVIVEHPAEIRKDLLELSNLGTDTLSNIIDSF